MCDVDIPFWTLVVLSLTLAVLCVYTYLTHKLHRATAAQAGELVEQRHLSVLPSLIHEISYDMPQGKSILHVRNIGNGAAVNVRLDRIPHTTDPNTFFQARQIGTIQAGQAKEATGTMFVQNEEFDESFNLVLHPSEEPGTSYDVVFRFQDIQGRQYVQRNQIVDGVYVHGKVEEAT